jgi:hypothetical protein
MMMLTVNLLNQYTNKVNTALPPNRFLDELKEYVEKDDHLQVGGEDNHGDIYDLRQKQQEARAKKHGHKKSLTTQFHMGKNMGPAKRVLPGLQSGRYGAVEPLTDAMTKAIFGTVSLGMDGNTSSTHKRQW